MSFQGYLKQSTTVTITLGPMVDKDDGNTEKTGLTIEDTDVYISKNGGAKANPNDTNNCSEDANGIYTKQLDATDTATLGLLTVYVHFTDCMYIRQDYQVVMAHWYDTMCGSDYLQVDTIQIESGDASDALDAATPDVTVSDKTGFSLSAAGNTAVIDEFETQAQADPTGFHVNVMEVNGAAQTANDNGADINEILTDTGSTLDTLIKDIPTNAEFAALLGALDTAANTGDPAADVTAMGYIKQLINILIGTDGIAAFPAKAAPANAVSIAEAIRGLYEDRTLAAADYTIVADLGTVQSGDSYAIVNGDHGLVSIQDDVDEILTDTGTTLDTLIKDIPTNAEAESIVNAQVLDVLNTDTFAEPGDEVPTSTTTLVDKIGYLYKFLRNKIETTSTRIHVYNDAGDNKDHSSIISDNGSTFTRGEFAAGD